jgi:hypothetical protein
MIGRRRLLAAKMHLPLRQLALCLDCDECFEIGSPTCPACGSATWTSLSRFLAQGSSARHRGRHDAAAKRRDDSSEILQQLIIVAGNRTHLYEHLKRIRRERNRSSALQSPGPTTTGTLRTR